MIPGSLNGIRIFDITRVLAGPSCTQMFGDLGADVIKIERPGAGDDTRKWGPPFLKDADGRDTTESAYYLSANRNKRSLALDFTTEKGAQLARDLIAKCDVVTENFKVGSLKKHGLDYPSLKAAVPRLIYCSVTGFGQTGPYAPRAGYDFVVQGMGGIMSLTGEKDGQPLKVAVGIADLMCGMYAGIGILAALRHRDATGEGQHIDMALLDTQIAWMSYLAQYTLISGENPPRLGNSHPTIVPYDVFPSSDGHLILAVGNDGQFQRFCKFAGRDDLAADPRFATTGARIANRALITPLLAEVLKSKPTAYWVDGLDDCAVPCGPINTMQQVFDDPQVIARQMVAPMAHPLAGETPLKTVASPIKLSETPPSYRRPPPTLGQHTDEVLRELLELRDDDIAALRAEKIIG
ncbi:MAG: CaiB/BaiF CoA transferase family protein [Alphaproteobacteria bacterium]